MNRDYDPSIDGNPGECPKCGLGAMYFDCERCGGEEFMELADCPEEWGEDCMSEENRLIVCPECNGTGGHWYCQHCTEATKGGPT